MRFVIAAIISCCSCIGQNLENNKNFSAYTIVEEEDVQTDWSTKYYLVDNKIIKEDTYCAKKQTKQISYIFNTDGDRQYEVENYNINDGNINDTVYSCKYDVNGRLIEKDYKVIKTLYSDFNDLGLPQKIEYCNSILPRIQNLIYDTCGNIIKETTITIINTVADTAIVEYKYNEHNDVIELHRKYIPERKFPIPVFGRYDEYEFEKFRYVYNKDGFWTKKYVIVDDAEFLYQRRKYKKKKD